MAFEGFSRFSGWDELLERVCLLQVFRLVLLIKNEAIFELLVCRNEQMVIVGFVIKIIEA